MTASPPAAGTRANELVTQVGLNLWVANVTYQNRELAKNAGFRWHPDHKHWWTADATVAAKLVPVDPAAAVKAKTQFEALTAEKRQRIAESRAESLDLEIARPPGLEYLPFQRAGIEYGRQRGNTLYGDDMGLGKTIQVIGRMNVDPSIRKVLIVCPATLKMNWMRELNKWLVGKYRIGITSGSRWLGAYADVVIINFDILERHAASIHAMQWDLIAIDEAHYLKNRDAKRTMVMLGIDKRQAKKLSEKATEKWVENGKCGPPPAEVKPHPGAQGRIHMACTGTPLPNRASEGFGMFHWLAPNVEEFSSFYKYGRAFCGSFENGNGYDKDGATNLDKLQEILRSTIMIRRTKAQVLKDLPAKRRVVVEIEPDLTESGLIAAEQEAAEAFEEELDTLRAAVELAKAGTDEEYREAVAALKKGAGFAFTEISRLRHETALATLPHAVEHIMTALRGDPDHKVVFFGHHGDVIDGLIEAMKAEGIGTARITQSVPVHLRQAESDRFQTDPRCRLFAGGIQSAGVGITLTAAWHVVFGELDWVPGNMSQAEDRCNRIGQRNSVLAEHLVLQGSIAATMAVRLVAKQNVIDSALDRDHPERIPEELKAELAEPIVPGSEAATELIDRSKYAKLALELSPGNIAAIHSGLRMLAALDGDHARTLNGIGFSRVDGMIGHSLANSGRLSPKQGALGQSLIRKYRGQLSEALVLAAGL